MPIDLGQLGCTRLFTFCDVCFCPLLALQSQKQLAQFDEPEQRTGHYKTKSPLAKRQCTCTERLVERWRVHYCNLQDYSQDNRPPKPSIGEQSPECTG